MQRFSCGIFSLCIGYYSFFWLELQLVVQVSSSAVHLVLLMVLEVLDEDGAEVFLWDILSLHRV